MPAPLHLQFELGSDRYLLPVGRVIEVLPLPALKELPGAPTGVAGVADRNGRAVPVVDLARLATGRPASDRRSTRLVLVRYPAPGGERPLGLVLERAVTVVRVSEGDFQAAGAAGAAWLGGVAPSAGSARLAQRVEVERLLPPALREMLFRDADAVLARAEGIG